MRKLAVASVVLQSKLLEEADVDLSKLEKKLTPLLRVSASKIQESERKIAKLLQWKLLTPSPQVILFTALDSLPLTLATSLKLLVSKVMDRLIEGFFLQELLQFSGDDFNLTSIVASVIEIVLADYFSVFPLSSSGSGVDDIQLQLQLQSTTKTKTKTNTFEEKLPKQFKERIEKAIETVVNGKM